MILEIPQSVRAVHVMIDLLIKNIDDKIMKVVDNAVLTVENRVHDATVTAIDNVIIPQVEMTVRSITGSS